MSETSSQTEAAASKRGGAAAAAGARTRSTSGRSTGGSSTKSSSGGTKKEQQRACGGGDAAADALASLGLGACFAPFSRRPQVMDQELVVPSVSAEAAAEATGADQDWGSLLPGLLTEIFEKAKTGQAGWPRRRTLFSVAGVCSNWRGVAYEVFFNAKHCSPTITHPCELFSTRPYPIPSSLLHCLVVRERYPSGEGPTQYYMYLGEPEQEPYEKFLLAASHCSKPGKDRFNMRMRMEYDAANEERDTIATLKTNLLCTNYSLDITWPQAGGSWSAANAQANERCKSTSSVGSMKYRRNFFGFRGPRKLNVQFPVMGGVPAVHDSAGEEAVPQAAGRGSSLWRNVGTASMRQLPANCRPDAARTGPAEEDALSPVASSALQSGSNIVLKNVPPHWHELLQCWCLNFGGRVKEASVKNFQLMHVGDEAVAMQFGKVSKDSFILDFNPTKIAPIQAFSVALSSFESKLPYE